VQPTLIDRIQDRYGKTIYRHDQRECRGCTAPKWENQNEPTLVDKRDRVIDPMTAYQITSIMEGVVQRGTATVVKEVGKPIAGKTGTTNDEKDAWFIGFSPDMVVGVYIGYDKPRHLGRGQTGGHLAAPIAKNFYKLALADKPRHIRSSTRPYPFEDAPVDGRGANHGGVCPSGARRRACCDAAACRAKRGHDRARQAFGGGDRYLRAHAISALPVPWYRVRRGRRYPRRHQRPRPAGHARCRQARDDRHPVARTAAGGLR